jgi:hypothetical protein
MHRSKNDSQIQLPAAWLHIQAVDVDIAEAASILAIYNLGLRHKLGAGRVSLFYPVEHAVEPNPDLHCDTLALEVASRA